MHSESGDMTTRPATPLALGFAALGMLSLAGCAVNSATAGTSNGTGTNSSNSSSAPAGSVYADGTYTTEASYQAPSGMESITVQLTVADDAVTAVTVTGDATDREAREFQSRFASAISSEVVGADLSTLTVTRVAGSSLTSNGFNAAVDDIRSQAS